MLARQRLNQCLPLSWLRTDLGRILFITTSQSLKGNAFHCTKWRWATQSWNKTSLDAKTSEYLKCRCTWAHQMSSETSGTQHENDSKHQYVLNWILRLISWHYMFIHTHTYSHSALFCWKRMRVEVLRGLDIVLLQVQSSCDVVVWPHFFRKEALWSQYSGKKHVLVIFIARKRIS